MGKKDYLTEARDSIEEYIQGDFDADDLMVALHKFAESEATREAGKAYLKAYMLAMEALLVEAKNRLIEDN